MHQFPSPKIVTLCSMFGLAALLSACEAPGGPTGISDPFEQSNRRTHALNLAIDQAIASPAADTYGAIVPEPVRDGLSNLSDTLSIPGTVLNDILQLSFGDAVHNTGRFLVNATIGLGGLFDPATGMGLEERDSDFGETLARWGVTEGNYLVLPVYGASTERDGLGIIVDWIIDPVGQIVSTPESYYTTALKGVEILDDRHRYDDLIDGVLYESADSYTQLRLTYLDNRRFELGQAASAASGEEGGGAANYDIYEDFYE